VGVDKEKNWNNAHEYTLNVGGLYNRSILFFILSVCMCGGSMKKKLFHFR